ncbi:SDR family NAD(P)-dependent oxidoreductase [Actinoplanes teichomyceticus]|uniref:NADP-dependent 3-hydroxy acid dehydrogenase YdfG n=1 Tax=Actinoplanes teichomyceticus TaxID=1867 RepID=A0A561WBN1_ACTTI|nr:SDR family NAD(P)-dependent oxidoreductase [Actinoplanes teichomyceticus]TWG21277.1 NADP-dependent 3-hydroxy acid dehydrogenase YdfG [Actinoplanes teichomyceticus]GIF16710.1 short-chain dehydrogenase/reductase [Actinoplanes teichomyceticus]
MSVWFVTGASRGLGSEIVEQLLDAGERVVAAARDPHALDRLAAYDHRLLAVPLDVTDPGQADAAVAAAVDRFGGIDVLVNNAGRGLIGAVEEASDEEVRSVFETNVFGLLNVVRSALPAMRGRRRGHLINISSILGFSAKPGWGVYAATKFAVEGLSEALRVELEPLGIRVSLVEPGLFRTNFLDPSSVRLAGRVIDDYAPTSGRVRAWAGTHNGAQAGDPAKAAAAIIALGDAAESTFRLPLGTDAVERVQLKLAEVTADLAATRTVGLAMSFPEPAVAAGR